MNPAAEPVVKKVLKPKDVAAVGGPMYGAFEYRGRVVQLQPDTNLRDNEDVPLTAETARGANVDAVNEAYFKKEVAPHVEDAWIDRGERDVRDGQVGVVGYEISFTRQFSEFMKFRNKSNLIKLKSCIARNPKGRHAWNALRRRFTLPESGDPLKLYDSETRVDVREDLLDVDYFNYFLETDEAGDWLVYAANDGSATHRYHLPISRLLECEFRLPAIQEQRKIVRLRGECDALQNRIKAIESQILAAPDEAELEIEKYQDLSNRFEEEFTHILPHPLSVLWIQAHASGDTKTQCQEFVKFHEYLGLFTNSVILGQLDDEQVKRVFKRVGGGSEERPNFTMGTTYKIVEVVREAYQDNVRPLFRLFVSEEWQLLLKGVTGRPLSDDPRPDRGSGWL